MNTDLVFNPEIDRSGYGLHAEASEKIDGTRHMRSGGYQNEFLVLI